MDWELKNYSLDEFIRKLAESNWIADKASTSIVMQIAVKREMRAIAVAVWYKLEQEIFAIARGEDYPKGTWP